MQTIKSNNERSSASFHVTGLTLAHEKIKLVTGLRSYNSAYFIEQQVEDYLSIEDETVADEPS